MAEIPTASACRLQGACVNRNVEMPEGVATSSELPVKDWTFFPEQPARKAQVLGCAGGPGRYF